VPEQAALGDNKQERAPPTKLSHQRDGVCHSEVLNDLVVFDLA
jgi:hypothetical protein